MRQRWAVIAALGILLGSAGAWAQGGSPEAELLVLSERSDQQPPTILRGNPASPPPARLAPAAPRVEVVGGKRLWVVDRSTGEIRSCINRQTSTVGLRLVRCTSAELGRYHRTFGPNFQP